MGAHEWGEGMRLGHEGTVAYVTEVLTESLRGAKATRDRGGSCGSRCLANRSRLKAITVNF